MTYVIAQPCVDLKDKACIERRPVDRIYAGASAASTSHPDERVDCGACEPVCPVEAIYYGDDVPEQWADPAQCQWDSSTTSAAPVAPQMRMISPAIIAASRPSGTRVSPAGMPRRTLPDFRGTPLAPPGAGECRPGGIVDLSIGTPVDSTPAVLQEALRGRRTPRLSARPIRDARPA